MSGVWRKLGPSKDSPGHAQGINDLAWSTDSSLICTVSDDRTLRIWDANRGTQLSVMKEHQAAAMSVAVNPQGNMIATGSWDEMVRIWDISTAKVVRVIHAHNEPISSVCFSRDGLLATASYGGECRIWGQTGEKCNMTLREQEDGVPVVSVSFSPNGRYVLASTIGNGASGPEGGPQQNGRILLYDATTGKVSRHYSGHMNRNYCIGSTFASKLVVSGSEDGLVYLWDLQKRTCVQRLGGHSSIVTGVATNATHSLLASCSLDGTVRVWEKLEQGVPPLTVRAIGDSRCTDYPPCDVNPADT